MKLNDDLERRLHAEYFKDLSILLRGDDGFVPPLKQKHLEVDNEKGGYVKNEGGRFVYMSRHTEKAKFVKVWYRDISTWEDRFYDYVEEEAEIFILKLRESQS